MRRAIRSQRPGLFEEIKIFQAWFPMKFYLFKGIYRHIKYAWFTNGIDGTFGW